LIQKEKNQYKATFWNPITKRETPLGFHPTREAAENAIVAKCNELGIPINKCRTAGFSRLNYSTREQKPVSLKFGVIE
jgi:hypothetical protein